MFVYDNIYKTKKGDSVAIFATELKGELFMQAILILLGLTAFWLVFSSIMFGGFWLLQELTFISQDKVFTFSDAANIGEYVTIGLIIAGIIVFILNALGVIDIRCFKRKA